MTKFNGSTSEKKYRDPFESRNYSFREKISYISNTNEYNNRTRLGRVVKILGGVIKVIFSFGRCSVDIKRSACVYLSRSRNRCLFQMKVLSMRATNYEISGRSGNSIPINCPIINWSKDGSHAVYRYLAYNRFAQTLIKHENNLDNANVDKIICDISRDAYYIMLELVKSDPSKSAKVSHINNAVLQLREKCGLLNNVNEYEDELNDHLSLCAEDIHYRMLVSIEDAADGYKNVVSYPCKHPCGTLG